MPNHKAYAIFEKESGRLEIAEADALVNNARTAVLFGVPGFERDELFLKLLGSYLSKGRSLVLHSKPVVRAEVLYDIVTNRDDLLSRAVFHYVPTLEEQERTLKRLSIDLSRTGIKTVLFDSPSDNYLVALALSMESQSKLKEVNASIVRHFAYLKTTALEMNAHVLVTMGERSGINTVEEYLLRYWPDLVIKFRASSESEAEFERNENTKLLDLSARVITIGG
ncbi:MAG TPA: hypothetical protein VEG31_03640 [Thermoproteota archaeon]|nr:hypothetical protein [Thermoproteota archaeon]